MFRDVSKRIITLITDFGMRDGYVGIMKGVILHINPDAVLVDVTHDVPPHDILAACFVLENSYWVFPPGSINLVVVDPGVGSNRRAILIEAGNHFFIGPDNGIFTRIYELEGIEKAVHLTNKRYFLPHRSNTFHGRDIFSPVAAYLSLGTSPEDFGDLFNDPVTIDIPRPELKRGMIKGMVSHVDSFGNLISNISQELFSESIGRERHKILVGDNVIDGIQESYSSVMEGEILAIFGSSGYLEISVREKSARETLGLGRGCEVIVIH